LRPHFRATLAPIIDKNFTGGSGRAFATMAAQIGREIERNTARLPAVAALRIPVKFIFGKYDPYLGAVAQDLVPHFANATLDILPAGHWPQLDMPKEVARLMLG
jgi:haloalkane dehalogenase